MTLDVKIFGDRNTCTRLLSRLVSQLDDCTVLPEGSYHAVALKAVEGMSGLLPDDLSEDERNRLMQLISDALVARRGPLASWKHSEPRFHSNFSSRSVHVLIAVKHPLPWLRSLFRRPYDNLNPRPEEKVFSVFLRKEWLAVRRERGPLFYKDPMDIWNRKAEAYLSFMSEAKGTSCKTMFVRSEDVTQDQTAVIKQVLDFLGRRDAAVSPIKDSTKESGRDSRFYQDYYANERWRDDFSVDDLIFACDRINWDLARQFGYDRPAP